MADEVDGLTTSEVLWGAAIRLPLKRHHKVDYVWIEPIAIIP